MALEKQIKWAKNNKKILIVGGVCFVIGLGIGMNNWISMNNEKDTIQKQYKTLETESNKLSVELKTSNDKIVNLEKKVADAKPWFDMSEEQKKAEETRLAEEKKVREAKEAEEKAIAEKTAQEQAAKEQAAKEAEEKKGYDTGITYDQLARTPDDFKGKKVKFSGEVIQVMEGQSETQIRFKVGGDYKKVIYAAIPKGLTSQRILENDKITIMGLSAGLLTYKSTMGGEITIPSVLVQKID